MIFLLIANIIFIIAILFIAYRRKDNEPSKAFSALASISLILGIINLAVQITRGW